MRQPRASAVRIPSSTARPFVFFFNDTATTEIYTLSLHDALPISGCNATTSRAVSPAWLDPPGGWRRSEEHTSELQSQSNLVCRLLLEKKKKNGHRRLPLRSRYPGPRG